MSDGEPQGAQPRRGKKRRSRRPRHDGLCGAIDLGTNNCRLLVARPTKDGFQIVDAYSRIVRLGEGVSRTGQLSPAAMDRSVEALKVCAEKLARRNVSKIRCIATQACRSAGNGPDFLDRVKTETGLRFDMITPREEARLAALGCLNLIDRSKDICMVLDIGGGSTELSIIDVAELQRRETAHKYAPPPIRAWTSLPIGVVTVAEDFPEPEDREPWFEEMKASVRVRLEGLEDFRRFRQAFEDDKAQIIGTSGTVTSVAGVHLRLPHYERSKVDGSWLNRTDCGAAVQRLLDATPEERAKEPCIGPERADLVLAGCAILEAVLDAWPCEKLRVADRGLREGVLYGLMGRYTPRRRRRRGRGNGGAAKQGETS